MHLIQVDVVGAEPAQAALARLDDVMARAGLMFRRLERRRPFRRDHDLGAPSAECLAQALLAGAVRRGRVEEVEPCVEGGGDDGVRRVLVDAEAEVVTADPDDGAFRPDDPS